ncbi:MAG: hypothetical protein V2B20_03150 [Pseudomonadota bacterium]
MPAGRPPKFDEPSIPVTVTLPTRILGHLGKIDSDRGKAIVKCVEGIAAACLDKDKRVEIIHVSENAGMIVTSRSQCLEGIPWLRMVEIAPGRFLLSIPSGTSITSLEVAILDLIEYEAAEDDYEQGLLEELRQCISHYRRREIVSKREILFIDIENLKNNLRNWILLIPLHIGIECFNFISDYSCEEMMLLQTFC